MSESLKRKILQLAKPWDKSVCVEEGGGIWFSELENLEWEHWTLLEDLRNK